MKKNLIVLVIGEAFLVFTTSWLSSASTSTTTVSPQKYVRGDALTNKSGSGIENRRLYRVDALTSSRVLIYEAEGDFISDILSSPNGKFIGFLEGKNQMRSLVIIRPEGQVADRLKSNIHKFSWSPTSGKVAFIQGVTSEGRWVIPQGVAIYDLMTKSIKKIADSALFLNWAIFDSNIYYSWNQRYYRYETKTGITEIVPYLGIDFSPDGKYYLSSHPDESFQVFERERNMNITDRFYKRFKHTPIRPTWYGGDSHLLLITYREVITDPKYENRPAKPIIGIREYHYYLYDIEKDSTVKEWREKPLQKE